MLYVYVDNNVTLKGEAKTNEYTGEEDGITYTSKETFSAFEIKLEKGWNMVTWKHEVSFSTTGSTFIHTIYKGSPSSARWVLDIWDDDDNDDDD